MNYLTYPLKVMNITQSYKGNYTHERHQKGNTKDYPIDDACGSGNNSYFYCPCDEMIVKKVYGVGLKASNTIWLESTTPVITPTFNDYVTLMIVHPEDKYLKNLYVGKRFSKNDKIFPKGKDGNATGPHFHITVGRGKFISGGWSKNNLGLWILKTTKENVKPEEAFFIDENFTTIKNTKNLNFIKLYNKDEDNIYYTTANLNIRLGPGTKYKLVNTIIKNTKIKVLSITGNWAKISDKEYVSKNFITKNKPSIIYESNKTTASFLNVRAKPNGKILYVIPKNTTVTSYKQKNGWTEIYNNRYVSTKYLK